MRFTGPGYHRGGSLPDPLMLPPDVRAELGFLYYYSVSIPANTTKTDALVLDTDADFVWRGVSVITGASLTTGVRFKDANSFYFSDGYLTTSLLWQAGTNGPFTILPVWPEQQFPAGGAIYMDWNNPTGAPVAATLVFHGSKRFASVR